MQDLAHSSSRVADATMPGMTRDIRAVGRSFIEREGRLVERRLAAVLFDDADPGGAVDAVLAYRNPDGGFGHGLEPDKRCPASLPIDVERALDILIEVGDGRGGVDALVMSACDWLGAVAWDDGAVPLAFPEIENYPCAEHWTDWTYVPGLNPTAGLTGRLHRMGVAHPWLTRATHWTWARLESGFDEDAHALVEVLQFLAYVPDRLRAEQYAVQVGDWLQDLRLLRASPDDPCYGLTPLHFAPAPNNPWRRLFDDATIDGHLDRMIRDQEPDGGWGITWNAPGVASTLEWRGIETLRALCTLSAYGRL